MAIDNLIPLSNEKGGKNTEIIRDDRDSHYVVLPCGMDDFASFVSGLLGKSEELRGETEGTFEIDHKSIATIYHLLQQRMAKQNDASLIYFGITVYYDD